MSGTVCHGTSHQQLLYPLCAGAWSLISSGAVSTERPYCYSPCAVTLSFHFNRYMMLCYVISRSRLIIYWSGAGKGTLCLCAYAVQPTKNISALNQWCQQQGIYCNMPLELVNTNHMWSAIHCLVNFIHLFMAHVRHKLASVIKYSIHDRENILKNQLNS